MSNLLCILVLHYIVMFNNMLGLCCVELSVPSWRTIPCQLSQTADTLHLL